MHEDTESFNENSNSEVIILPQNTHLEETLISDDEETDSETPHSYDAKLNAKLKDLGLYEDGMTIQQKEELLAVVAVSFKTAEEEKSRRRWYEEYANAALAFPEDEIEFSFQESPDSELSKASYSGDYHISAASSKKSSSRESGNNSTDVTEDNFNSDVYQDLPSTSQEGSSKFAAVNSQARKNCARGTSNAYKIALNEGNTVTTHSTVTVLNYRDAQLNINKQKKQYLEKCMSHWKPCLSPKDEPLACSSRLLPDEREESHSQTELNSNQKILSCVKDFSFALDEIKRARKKPSHFGKPYHLTRSGHCLKKTTKLDSLDLMVGVKEDRTEATSESSSSNFETVKKEPFSRTSWGAFRYAQLHRDRINALKHNSAPVNNHNSCMTTSPGRKYCIRQPVEETTSPPEIVIEDGLENEDILLTASVEPNSSGSGNHHAEQFNCEDHENNVPDAKLPKFSNLRPDLCRENFSEKHIYNRHVSHTYTGPPSTSYCEGSRKNHSFRKDNHIDSACADGELSDSSSVIDVETIVDEEIEEFVLKRKLVQEPLSDRQTYSNRSKRLRKSTS